MFPPKKSPTHKPGASRSFPRGGSPRPPGRGGGMPPGGGGGLPPQLMQLAAQFIPQILAGMMGGGGGGASPPGGMPSPSAFTGNGPPQPPAQGAISAPSTQDELDATQQAMGAQPRNY